MEEMCPISLKKINEKAAQLNAFLVVISMLLFLFTSYKWIIFIACADFFIRGFLNPAYSYYGSLSKILMSILKIKPSMVDAGPKIFAAKIGFIFCLLIFLFYILNYDTASVVFSAILLLFASLEAFFKFCLACKIYPLLKKVI